MLLNQLACSLRQCVDASCLAWLIRSNGVVLFLACHLNDTLTTPNTCLLSTFYCRDGGATSRPFNQHDGTPGSPVLAVPREDAKQTPPMSLWQELMGCIRSPLFLAVSFGYASYSAVVAGLGFYGPLFIQTNRPCDPRWDFTQENADFVFGSIVAATGFVGTALGGLWLDHKASKLAPDRRYVSPSKALAWSLL